MNGRKCDVLIENDIGHSVIVWADEGMKETIKSVEGVSWVYESGTKYWVDLDKRYNKKWIIAEIEAAIKCRE